MVSVVVNRDKTGKTTGFTCSGHANFAEKGSDIVCAGISSLTHTTVLALERLTNLKLRIKQNNKNGFLECCWVNIAEENDRPDLIMKVMLIGLQEIQEQYPHYLKVCDMEV